MGGLELPRHLRQALQEDATVRVSRGAWASALPVTIQDLAERWSLTVGRPFQPGSDASWVAPARTPAGEHLVLKVGWMHDEARHEADGLRAWQGDGTVRLIDALAVGETNALLLEACEPGTPLSSVLPVEDQDVVVAGLLRRVWIDPSPNHPFRSLQSMCDAWAQEFEQGYSTADPARRLDAGLARAGMELFRSLPGSAIRSTLLCTDLHPDNVLAARREPWLAIDPKPYVGDPTYDPLQHMLNFPDRLSAGARGFAERMADLLDLDADRLRHWLFARCVQESTNDHDLCAAATTLAP
jgi:streptomycin 6-kinase